MSALNLISTKFLIFYLYLNSGIAEGKMRVCVIGGGAAGLCAVRHLARDLAFFEITAFEESANIGGTWIYTDKTHLDNSNVSVHSSMYKSLRTNLPGELMNFPDFRKMNSTKNSSLAHDEILKYLQDYAAEFDLYQYFQFHKKVEEVSPSLNATFDVRVRNVKNGESEMYNCDAVLVCNGHYFQPYIPVIPGIETFPGKVLHSHTYRKPDGFVGKTVIILGASHSGIDISNELSNYALHVFLSHNKPKLTGKKPQKVTEVAGIKSIKDNVFELLDGTSVTADVLIFCTGYDYNFPFLSDKLGIVIQQRFVSPLYKHIINVNYPKMGFIGIPSQIVPFPLFHIQVQYYLATLKGQAKLPTKDEMLEDSKLKNKEKKYAHRFGSEQWIYNDNLASAGHFQPLPRFYEIGHEAWIKERTKDMWNFKTAKFILSRDEKNVLVLPANST